MCIRDSVINYIGEGKFRLKKSGDHYKVDIKSYAHVLDEGLFDQKFNAQDMKNLEMYGNLGRVLETSEGPLLVSRDFDTRQLDYSNAENAFIPRYLRGTELKQDDIDGFRRGEIRNIAIVGRDGSVTVVPYQYNAVFRKPMELLTLEQRNALASELRKQRDLERIISTSPEDSGERLQYPQTPKQSAEQAAETATQGQAPAPEPSQQTQTAETAVQQQGPVPAPDLFGAGQQTQAPGAAKQGQATATASGQHQKPQGPEPGKEQKPAPRPQVKTPEPKVGPGKGKHL